jgi:hypothetical protein
MTSDASSPRGEALLIACAEYDDPTLRQLRAPGHDLEALSGVLADRGIGNFTVKTVRDRASHEVMGEIDNFFADRAPDDLLIAYVSCHGVKDELGQLYFAARNTRVDRLPSTGVSAEFLNQQMSRSWSNRIVLLLDCCYSGAFASGNKGANAVDLGERFNGRGRVVLTASSAMEYAFETGEILGEGSASVFTSALVEGLRTGEADLDHDGIVTVDELFSFVAATVASTRRGQTPSKWSFGLDGDIPIARGAKGPIAQLPVSVRQAAVSGHPHMRAVAVEMLAELLASDDASVSEAAHVELERLVGDDDEAVSTAAQIALHGLPAERLVEPTTPRSDDLPPETTSTEPDLVVDSGAAAEPKPRHRKRLGVAVAIGVVAVCSLVGVRLAVRDTTPQLGPTGRSLQELVGLPTGTGCTDADETSRRLSTAHDVTAVINCIHRAYDDVESVPAGARPNVTRFQFVQYKDSAAMEAAFTAKTVGLTSVEKRVGKVGAYPVTATIGDHPKVEDKFQKDVMELVWTYDAANVVGVLSAYVPVAGEREVAITYWENVGIA